MNREPTWFQFQPTPACPGGRPRRLIPCRPTLGNDVPIHLRRFAHGKARATAAGAVAGYTAYEGQTIVRAGHSRSTFRIPAVLDVLAATAPPPLADLCPDVLPYVRGRRPLGCRDYLTMPVSPRCRKPLEERVRGGAIDVALQHQPGTLDLAIRGLSARGPDRRGVGLDGLRHNLKGACWSPRLVDPGDDLAGVPG